MSSTQIKSLDLTQDYPRSPRAMLGDFVIAGRTLDKCRAVIAGTQGEYHYDCPLDQIFLNFAGIDSGKFKEFVATGASDEEVIDWIEENGSEHSKEGIVEWNNDLRYKRISEMPIELQVFLESYIPEVIPEGRIINYWFDVYDVEEGRM